MKARTILPFLALAAFTACSDTVGTADDLTEAEVVQLSDDLVTSTFESTTQVATDDDQPAAMIEGSLETAATTMTTEFTLTRTCPIDGQVLVEGTREREWDRATGTGSMTLHLTRTHQDCARPVQSADGGTATVITLNGEVVVDAYHEWVMGERRGIQTLTMVGELEWATDDGRTGTCEIDVLAEFDPETHTRTVTGTFCGFGIQHTRAWQHGGMGGGGGGSGGGGMGG